MEFKDAYSSTVGLPFEKVIKDGKQFIRQINQDELYEYSHDKLEAEYTKDPLIALAGYIRRNLNTYQNTIIDLGGNIALSNLTRSEFSAKEKEIYEEFYTGDQDNYEGYKSAIEKFRGDNLFYIVVPGLEPFYQNEPLIMIPEVKDFIQTMHWHIDEKKPQEIADILYSWKLIYKSLSNFSTLTQN